MDIAKWLPVAQLVLAVAQLAVVIAVLVIVRSRRPDLRAAIESHVLDRVRRGESLDGGGIAMLRERLRVRAAQPSAEREG